LPRLTHLNLNGNRIGVNGAKALLEAWYHAAPLASARTVDLSANRDLESVVPSEIVTSANAEVILAACRSHQATKP
jgi:hypothetical protein